MADKPPAHPVPAAGRPGAGRPDAEQTMLMREVDEAVRQDQAGDLAKKYGIPVAIALVLALILFGAWLFWQSSRESALEQGSEELVLAIDELEAGNLQVADEELAALVEDAAPGAAISARLIRAGIAVQQQRTDEAVALYNQVIANGEAPEPFRDFAAIRAVALQYGQLEPQEVIDRLGPLAVPESAWFGSAGELVAMAYLAQGNEEQAGALLGQIAQAEDVPPTLRARTRQLAGLLGYDAVEDVGETLARIRVVGGEAASVPSASPPGSPPASPSGAQ